MNSVNNLLKKTDCFCDYVPLVSSATNLVDLFQKCAIFPLIDESKIESNHYYKYINEKSFLRCFLLVIPVVGNIIVGIYDFSNKQAASPKDGERTQLSRIGDHQNVVDGPSKGAPVQSPIETIQVDDIEKIDIASLCAQSWPCQHEATVTLKDGREASVFGGYDIYSIVSTVSEKRINPGKQWTAESVKKHFSQYSTPELGWEPKPPEKVLNNIFSRKYFTEEKSDLSAHL